MYLSGRLDLNLSASGLLTENVVIPKCSCLGLPQATNCGEPPRYTWGQLNPYNMELVVLEKASFPGTIPKAVKLCPTAGFSLLDKPALHGCLTVNLSSLVS